MAESQTERGVNEISKGEKNMDDEFRATSKGGVSAAKRASLKRKKAGSKSSKSSKTKRKKTKSKRK